MVCWRGLMVMVKRFEVWFASLLAIRQAGKQKGRWKQEEYH